MFDKLGAHLKEAEDRYEQTLPVQTPVILRLDGKAFHTFTRGFEKPFSKVIHKCMVKTAAVLCKEIQNARFAYTQSDEISILIFEQFEKSHPWFGNRVQKMASVASSVCTSTFNRELSGIVLRNYGSFVPYAEKMPQFLKCDAYFDARVFSLPPEEVASYFGWRHEDCVRNSISMLAQAHFSHKKLHKKNRRDMLDMLESKEISWEDLADWKKNGSAIVKMWREKKGPNGEVVHRSYWDSLKECPLFAANTDFIRDHIEREEINA